MKITPVAKRGVLSRVHHVVIKDEWDLPMTFLRMQEWYESPKYHHAVFTIEEYMRWYAKTYGKGAFTYPKDWTGFNVPSDAVIAVMNLMEPWTSDEEKLFALLLKQGLIKMNLQSSRNLYFAPQTFYLIGTTGAEPSTLKHEIAHGRFFVDAIYRNDVLRELRKYHTAPLGAFLLKKGYSKYTLEDEIHAYVLTGFPTSFKPTPELLSLRGRLRDVIAKA